MAASETPPPDTPTTWQFASADPPDEATCRALAEFVLRSQDEPRWYPKEKDRIFDWKLRENECHPGFASLMVTPDGRPVSSCTVTPKRYWVGGAEARWAEIGDTFTDPDYQRRGMFAAVTDASRTRAQEAGFEVVYGLPNDQSLPPYVKKLGFAIKPDVEQMDQTLVLSSRGIARKARDSGRGALAKALASPLLARGSHALVRAILGSGRVRGIEVGEERIFGAEFDELWRRVRPALPCAQVRDARYLRWRYRANPMPFRLLAARSPSGLEGYLVLLVHPAEGADAPRRMYLVDWLYAPDARDGAGRALLGAALRTALDEGVELVVAHNARRSPLSLPWPRGPLVTRPVEKPVIVHQSDAGKRVIADPAPWHFTLSDSDAF